MLELTDQQLSERIESALDTIRHHLQADGGDVEYVGMTEDGVVQIKWLGACQACNMSTMTMKAGVEQAIKSYLPAVQGVIAVNGIDAKSA